MNILLTGAFGNLGSLVLEQLLNSGHQVSAFDIASPINRKIARSFNGKNGLTIIWGDIRNAEQVKALVQGQDAIIHVAAMIAPFSENNPQLAYDINVKGTQHLLDGIHEAGSKPLFIFTSSFAVYGYRQKDPPPRTLDEAVCATDHYSQHKIEGEQMVQALDSPWVILRLAGMVDARMRHSDKEQAKLGFRLAANNRIEYIHPKDAVTAIVHALERPEAHNKIHLIGGGKRCQVTHFDLLHTVLGAIGIQLTPADFGEQELYADWADTSESQRLLDFQHHSFADFKAESYHKFRFVRPFVRPFSSVIKFFMMKALGV